MGESKVTLEFIREILRKEDPSIDIQHLEESPGSKRGDNYTASLYRVSVSGFKNSKPWESSVIYKCLPENAARREAFKSDALFQNEVAFYNKIVPLFNQFLASKSLTKFGALPKCYYASRDLIVLEDLKNRGFVMPDRKKGLNLTEIGFVLPELAKFHAISMAIKILLPSEILPLLNSDSGISEVLFAEKNEEWYRNYYKCAIENVLSMVKRKLKSDPNQKKYIDKFTSFANESFFNNMINLISTKGPLAVLCHGDCWTNNIMFRRNNMDEILDVCFIDFQLCRYGSLALDLAYLIYCCTTYHLRKNHLQSLLEKYHLSFHSTLSQFLSNTTHKNHELLNMDFSWSVLLAEFRRCSLFGLGLAIDMIPISTCDSQEAPDMYEDKEVDDELVPVTVASDLCATKMVNLICELVDKEIL